MERNLEPIVDFVMRENKLSWLDKNRSARRRVMVCGEFADREDDHASERRVARLPDERLAIERSERIRVIATTTAFHLPGDHSGPQGCAAGLALDVMGGHG